MSDTARQEFLRDWYEGMKYADKHHFAEHEHLTDSGYTVICEYPFETFVQSPMVVFGLKAMSAALDKRPWKKSRPHSEWLAEVKAKQALEAIAAFPNMDRIQEYCKEFELCSAVSAENLPPYLIMAKIADHASKLAAEVPMVKPSQPLPAPAGEPSEEEMKEQSKYEWQRDEDVDVPSLPEALEGLMQIGCWEAVVGTEDWRCRWCKNIKFKVQVNGPHRGDCEYMLAKLARKNVAGEPKMPDEPKVLRMEVITLGEDNWLVRRWTTDVNYSFDMECTISASSAVEAITEAVKRGSWA